MDLDTWLDLLLLRLPWLPLAFAGGLGGAIRWASMRADWRKGLGHVVAGAIIGTYFGPAIFPLVQPLADFSGMLPEDARLLGAHVAGAFGLNIYTIPADLIRGRALAIKAATLADGKDPDQ